MLRRIVNLLSCNYWSDLLLVEKRYALNWRQLKTNVYVLLIRVTARRLTCPLTRNVAAWSAIVADASSVMRLQGPVSSFNTTSTMVRC